MEDLHNHSLWSDGSDSIKKLDKHKKRWRFSRFAVSDHYHMIDNYDKYIESLAKYSITKAVEIYAPHIVKNIVDIDWCNSKLDFVIIEDFPMNIEIEQIIEHFNIPIIAAHPDPIIIPKIVGLGIAYEINLSHGIPDKKVLQQLVDNKIKVTVGSDIHDLSQFNISLLRHVNKIADAMNNNMAAI